MTIRILTVLLMLLMPAGTVLAESAAEWTQCKGESHDAAIAACTRIIDDASTSPTNRGIAYYNRAISKNARGDRDAAIADYGEAIKLRPNDPDAYVNRGNIYRAKRQTERAVADLDQAIKLKPGDPDLYLNRALCYAERAQNDKAIADYSEAIRLRPNYAEAYSGRGNRYHAMRDYDRAIADYDQAIKYKPEYAPAYLNRGNSLRAKKDYDRAIADFDQAIKLKPDYAAAFYRRGLSYLDKGDRARAILDYARAETIPVPENDDFNKRQQELAKKDLKAMLDAPTAPPKNPTAPQKPLKRYALVIANSKYQSIKPLENPARDAAGIAQALNGLGFDVTTRENLNRATLRSELRIFEGRIRKDTPDWALVYFSGHGTETAEGAFMLPVDVLLEKEGEYSSDLNIVEDSVSVQNVLKRMQSAKALRLVIYDACRDNPALSAFNRVIHQSRQAVSGANRSTGMGWGRDLVIFATSPGTFALDGEPGEMSPFAKSLVTEISKPGLELKDMVRELADEVENTTKTKRVVAQRPQVYGFPLEGEHYFKPKSMEAAGK